MPKKIWKQIRCEYCGIVDEEKYYSNVKFKHDEDSMPLGQCSKCLEKMTKKMVRKMNNLKIGGNFKFCLGDQDFAYKRVSKDAYKLFRRKP